MISSIPDVTEYTDEPDRLDAIDDVHLYRDIIFAERLRYSTENFSARAVPELEDIAARLVHRLNSGWFAESRLVRSPQAWFSQTGEIGEISGETGSTAKKATESTEKPCSALWTSSFLPNKESSWKLVEMAEFSHQKRDVFSVHFAENEARIYSIDSVADYAQLVSRYPRVLDDNRVGVDWAEVAADFHAVHLTVLGLVTAHDQEFSTPKGMACLRDWESESTAWLRRPPYCRVVAA